MQTGPCTIQNFDSNNTLRHKRNDIKILLVSLFPFCFFFCGLQSITQIFSPENLKKLLTFQFHGFTHQSIMLFYCCQKQLVFPGVLKKFLHFFKLSIFLWLYLLITNNDRNNNLTDFHFIVWNFDLCSAVSLDINQYIF